jgi:hypothetical protein
MMIATLCNGADERKIESPLENDFGPDDFNSMNRKGTILSMHTLYARRLVGFFFFFFFWKQSHLIRRRV